MLNNLNIQNVGWYVSYSFVKCLQRRFLKESKQVKRKERQWFICTDIQTHTMAMYQYSSFFFFLNNSSLYACKFIVKCESSLNCLDVLL